VPEGRYTGRLAQNRTLPPLVSAPTFLKPAASSLPGNWTGSRVTIVSVRWNICIHTDRRLSEPAKVPPGLRTRNASQNSRSCRAGEGIWCSIVNERTTENIRSWNGIAVASPTCTLTFESAVRSRRERARLRSSSRHVRCRHWGRSQSVVRPGPGPSSRTSPPKSTPFRDQGKISVPSLCLQWFDWQYQRCSRFILSPPG